MNHQSIFFTLVISLSILCSCGSSDQENTNTSEVVSFERNPKEVVSAHGIDLEIYDFENFQAFLNRDDDQIHVINFWATWCVPCVQELPYFEELGKKYREIPITLVSLDFRKAVESDLIPFIKENKLKSDVIMLHEADANSWVPKVDPNWSGAIPATIIYRGNKSNFYEQSFTFEELETEVLKFKK